MFDIKPISYLLPKFKKRIIIAEKIVGVVRRMWLSSKNRRVGSKLFVFWEPG